MFQCHLESHFSLPRIKSDTLAVSGETINKIINKIKLYDIYLSL